MNQAIEKGKTRKAIRNKLMTILRSKYITNRGAWSIKELKAFNPRMYRRYKQERAKVQHYVKCAVPMTETELEMYNLYCEHT